jgi:hypothetical protein
VPDDWKSAIVLPIFKKVLPLVLQIIDLFL